MSLNQKYTWAQFLAEKPEIKKKGVKRTSSEGKKAFESAYKAHIKKHLTARAERIKALEKKAVEKKNVLTKKVSTFAAAGDFKNAKFYQKKIGLQDSWLSRLSRQAERVKLLQKSF